MPHRNKPPASDEHFFRHAIPIGAHLESFDSLKKLKSFASEAYRLVGEKSWEHATLKDIDTSEGHLRAGFIGTVAVESAMLVVDGEIRATDGMVLDGILVQLDMLFKPTGKSPMQIMGGLALGSGRKRFEVRAYDLERKTFGSIHSEELKDYLQKSKNRGGGTISGASRRAGQSLGKSGINST